jgi:chemotaxis protein MotB
VQLNQNLQSEVSANQVQIKQLQNRLEVTMINSILFQEGGWELDQQGQQEMNKVIPALQGVSGKQIVIGGYTDNLPILPPLSNRFPTNWSLSAARAISVVVYLCRGIRQIPPIASNDTSEGRAMNRRINIVIQDQTP